MNKVTRTLLTFMGPLWLAFAMIDGDDEAKKHMALIIANVWIAASLLFHSFKGHLTRDAKELTKLEKLLMLEASLQMQEHPSKDARWFAGSVYKYFDAKENE